MKNEENILIRNISQGDKHSFKKVYEKYFTGLYFYARKFVFEEETAEEIVQDVFFKLWKLRKKISIQTSLKSYLFRAVYNECLNFLKHRKVERKFREESARRVGMHMLDYPDSLIAKELDTEIRQAIESLPEQRQKIFRMSRTENLKYREIAQKLDISVKTVEAQMSKALESLRYRLREFLPYLVIVVEIIKKNF